MSPDKGVFKRKGSDVWQHRVFIPKDVRNLKADRVDRRLLQHRANTRRVVVALRERSGRTLARSFRLESNGVAFARQRIVEGSVVAADDVRHWDVLASSFSMERIDHSEVICSRELEDGSDQLPLVATRTLFRSKKPAF